MSQHFVDWVFAWNRGMDLSRFYTEDALVYEHPGRWMGTSLAIPVFFDLDMSRAQSPWEPMQIIQQFHFDTDLRLYIHQSSGSQGEYRIMSLIPVDQSDSLISLQLFLPVPDGIHQGAGISSSLDLEMLVQDWLQDSVAMGASDFVEKWYSPQLVHMNSYGVLEDQESLSQSFSLMSTQEEAPKYQVLFQEVWGQEGIVLLKLLPYQSPVILIFRGSQESGDKIVFEAAY